ncbi:MAG: translation initiation factor IF-2 subunit beta [Sulfolobales archaeon]|nr:translation initiation factor IF-2 subunit beta [Sulfolobales archaeon]MCX8208307.1 translation initiation factor IF-2 subunit beta [Sulfolobales archaeon]MDW8010005.1 translation initiation factor IF-2 subunit beta [Sulfolobales archaeon]
MEILKLGYDELLERLYSKLPLRRTEVAVEIPRLETEVAGIHTRVKNFKLVCEIINRDPRLVLRYLLKSMGAKGSLDRDGNAVVHQNVSKASLNKLFEKFIELYVKCPTCHSYQSELRREGKIWVLKCLACGAETTVRPAW